MFSSRSSGSKNTYGNASSSNAKNGVPSIISADLSILGNLISDGSIEVEGRVEGNITCGKVTVHKNGFVKGDIVAEEVNINGEIRGLVKARHVQLSENGKVIGVIMYETLSIEDGALVDGQCKNTDKLHRGELDMVEASLHEEDADDIRLISDDLAMDDVTESVKKKKAPVEADA